jgi:hypothetical protein
MMKLPSNQLIKIDNFKGINQSADYAQIDIRESPDMLNMELDNKGALNKRKGYKRIFESLGAGNINGQYVYARKDGSLIELFAYTDKLYKLENDVPTAVYTGLNNNRVRFFTMNDICYMLDGSHFLQFDGSTVKEPEPYVPLVYLSDSANNNRVKNEDFNLIGAGFREQFVGDGSIVTFQLSLKGLDSTAVKAVVDGVIKTEGTDFTVDRVAGTVTFNVAPPKNTINANNIEITAYKSSASNKAMILGCIIRTMFGGSNDTRVLLSGNKDYPNRVWRSGIYDATYWPDNGYMDIGSNNERVINFSKQYDSCIVLKERSIWNMTFNIDDTGALFPTKPINEQTGCIAECSVQIIENNPVFLTRKGVYMLNQSNVRDERNIKLISENVNKSLLAESNLQNAVSVDYNGKYMLFVNGRGYIYDYRQGAWYIWDNINAVTFLEKDSLYFGNTNGTICRMKLEGEAESFLDDGESINAYWYSKLMDFGISERKKTVSRIFYSLKPATRTSAELYKITNVSDEVLIHSTRMDLFTFYPLYFDYFSFLANALPQSEAAKAKIKKIVYFQVKIQNNKFDEALGVNSISFELVPSDFVK